MRAIVCWLIVLLLVACPIVRAATNLDKQTLEQLAQVEQRYFGHSFDNDTDEERARRMETLVFGGANAGDPAQRIAHLLDVTNTADEDEQAPQTASATTPAAQPSSAGDAYPHVTALENAILGQSHAGEKLSDRLSRMEAKVFGRPSTSTDLSKRTDALEQYAEQKLHKTAVKTAPASDSDDDASDNVSGGGTQPQAAQTPYPRIDALERAILGQTYSGEALPGRLGRMETKAFGKASTSADLSQRTDDLQDYAEQKLHKGVVQTNQAADSDDDSADNTADNASGGSQPPATHMAYPRIDALERAILGETHAADALGDRLGRMETKAFGKPSQDPDLSHRSDMLEAYAKKKLHKDPIAENKGNDKDDSGDGSQKNSNRQKQMLAFAANTLLGLAGMGGMGGMMPGVGPSFLPGLAPGQASGPRRNRRHQAQQDSQTAEQPKTPPEDPAVSAPDPPPLSAKLRTKVGWCETQVFGHTNPQMHLEDRLDQLNQQLKVAPGKSGADLMDSIGAMITAVVSQKQPQKAVGATSHSIVQ